MVNVLVAGNEMDRRYLSGLLDSIDEVNLLGEADNGSQALALSATLNPDVIFLGLEISELKCCYLLEVMKKI